MPRPLPAERKRWEDPIVTEVRNAREELFAAAGHDLNELCRRLSEQQRQRSVAVTRPPRKPEHQAVAAPRARPNKRLQTTARTKRRG